jgi:hypothetical protein
VIQRYYQLAIAEKLDGMVVAVHLIWLCAAAIAHFL